MSSLELEREQIEQALGGDESAWIPLVHKHQEAVFRLAYLLLRDADAAEDVAQETFIRAFRSLSQFDLSKPLRPWLLQISKNLAYNHQRSLRRYLAALQRWFESEAELRQIIHDAAHQVQTETIHAAITQLRQSDQEIVYLRYFLELSVNETADALGIANGTVKSRLSRALGRLQKIVENEYPTLREEYLHER